MDLAGENRDKDETISDPSAKSTCDPHDNSCHCASANRTQQDHEPGCFHRRRPGGSGAHKVGEAHNHGRQPPRDLPMHAPLPNRQRAIMSIPIREITWAGRNMT